MEIVLDTAAFIEYYQPDLTIATYYTTSGVCSEIRDQTAREKLQFLRPFLNIRAPSIKALKVVQQFAQKTGDIQFLSEVDIGVLALTYDLEIAQNGLKNINKDPKPFKIVNEQKHPHEQQEIEKQIEKQSAQEQEEQISVIEDEQDDDEEGWITAENLHLYTNGSLSISTSDAFVGQTPSLKSIQSSSSQQQQKKQQQQQQYQQQQSPQINNSQQSQQIKDQVQLEQDQQQEFFKQQPQQQDTQQLNEQLTEFFAPLKQPAKDDDINNKQDEQLSPSILQEIQSTSEQTTQSNTTNQQSQAQSNVYLITGDYSMQNVASMMGISLMAVGGKLITQVRHYILNCTACHTLVHDVTRRFCPECGTFGLQRLNCELDSITGEVTIFMRPPKPGLKRGSQYDIPIPKGGRKGQPLVLREDQYYERLRKTHKQVGHRPNGNNRGKDGYVTSWDEDYDPLYNVASKREFIGLGARNPNEPRHPHPSRKRHGKR